MKTNKELTLKFIEYLNDKKYSELNEKWRKHIKRMFSFIEEDDEIHLCHYWDEMGKPDLLFIVRDSKIAVTIKGGKSPIIHWEYFTAFTKYLANIGVSQKTIDFLHLYHYGYSKECPKTPLTKEEIVSKYSEQIKEANEELNSEIILDKITTRCVALGNADYRWPMQYFYYGSVEKGFLATSEQCYDSIASKKEIESTFIHFGELTYSPASRDPNKKIRHFVKIKWPILCPLYYTVVDEDDFMQREKLWAYFHQKDLNEIKIND